MIARMILMFVLLLAPPAFAQTAPAGNAHPETSLISGGTDGQTRSHPFGEIDLSLATPADKRDLASGVDLGPLRGLAVFHNGRVKILDTLARETVHSLTGKRAFKDFVRESPGQEIPEVVKHDPLFTLLDLWIDPLYYDDKALIGVAYLPLREEILAMEFAGDQPAQQRWKRLAMVSPAMVSAYATPIFNRHASEEPFRTGISRAESALQLARFGIANAVLVAPEAADDPWIHIATLEDDHPARAAAGELGSAWRAGSVEGVNAAIAHLAETLPEINPETYPTTRRSLELAYNRANAFEWGYWAYFFSLLALVLAFGTGRKWLVVTGVSIFAVALALHTFGFATRCIIAERFAIQNQFESMTGISLFAAIVGLGLMVFLKQWLFGAAAAATGFLVLITATQTDIPGEFVEREAAILNTSVLLKYHVTTVLTSYGLITLGFVVSCFYLATHYGAKIFGLKSADGEPKAETFTASAAPGLKKTLKDLDTATMTILQLAFWTLGVGTLLGAWWADHSWGRWWAFDPKETWALVTWIVYLIVIHVRFTNLKDRGLTTAWLSVLGFFVMLWTYFGVNLLLPGLHAYA